MEKLFFAHLFPFSEKAKSILKEEGVTISDIPESVIRKSALIISRANSKKIYSLDIASPSEELLLQEIMAFPVSKMFASLSRVSNMPEKLSELFLKKTFQEIINSPSPKDIAIELADDFKIKYSFLEEEDFFVEIELLDYLDNYFIDDEMKLINKRVEEGKVFLTLNDFIRFLGEKAYQKIFDSLPIEKEKIPKQLHAFAKTIDSQLTKIERKNFDTRLSGKIDPDSFPPCMKVLYDEQLSAQPLSYMARLSLASFLYQLGMSKTQMLTLFSKSPDYKKHIAQYHIDRIFERELSAPGCRKMKEYNLAVGECRDCKYKHPMQYYISRLRIRNRRKNNVSKKQ